MAYLIKIGLHPQNKSGLGSRGYRVWRRGTVVNVEFGPIECVGGGGGTHRWLHPPQTRGSRHFSTEREAELFRRAKVAEKQARGYQRLPSGRRIA